MKVFSMKPFNFDKFSTRVSQELLRRRAVTYPYRLYQMKQAGINQIIDLHNSAFFQSRLEKFFCKLISIKYYNYKYPYRLHYVPEHVFFEKINKTITENDGQTYIHCQYGKRRTGICVAVYEKECLNRSKDQILTEMLSIGFKDIYTNANSRKCRHLQSIFSDFVNRYFP